MEAFELRLWDGRLGRWLTVDPMGQYASPYLGMGNNPIGMIDPDGGKADDIIYLDQGGKEIYRIAQAGPDVFYQETYPLSMHSGANVGSFELTIPRNTNYVNPSMISQMSSFDSGFMDFERWRRDDRNNVFLHMGAELTYGTVDNAFIFLTGFGTNRRGISGETYSGDSGAEKGLDGFVTLASLGAGELVKSSEELLKSTPKLWNSFQRMHVKSATRTEVSNAFREMLLKNHNNFYFNKSYQEFSNVQQQIGRIGAFKEANK